MNLNVDARHYLPSILIVSLLQYPKRSNVNPFFPVTVESSRCVAACVTRLFKACQNGFAQHLEHLLFYGADSSSQNAAGNTALHVSALYNKASTLPLLWESCVRVLLYRGADKEAQNHLGQTPFQLAIMAGHFDLGEILKNHKDCDVVPFLESPKYVPKRKESVHTLPLPSLHSHPLLRANSDNSMVQSDPLAHQAAAHPTAGQV
ncbi:SH3 and multiple ankyrin repeat domains protein 1 [Liparis tanakae]|uniref:SH3 and multiple ankyrin repeat domains protein 1 n=1 Tax=Liparis tanakae TaxID=230148 RepID=A0A4Z2E3K1_9TELE|nr:SH3 and multiple ankyrin repeat domains protein 1 [Liparis tanakae]